MPSSSLIRWLDTNTVRPSAASARSSSRIHWIPSGSRPIVGSSRSRIGGSPRSAAATPRRCRMPSESAFAPAAPDAREPDELEHLVRPRRRDPVAPREPDEVAARRAARVDGARVEERPDRRQRPRDRPVRPAVDERLAGVGVCEAEHQLHRRRLARAVRSDEPRDQAGTHGDREVVDRDRAPVALRQPVGLDRRRHGSDGTTAGLEPRRARAVSCARHRAVTPGVALTRAGESEDREPRARRGRAGRGDNARMELARDGQRAVVVARRLFAGRDGRIALTLVLAVARGAGGEPLHARRVRRRVPVRAAAATRRSRSSSTSSRSRRSSSSRGFPLLAAAWSVVLRPRRPRVTRGVADAHRARGDALLRRVPRRAARPRLRRRPDAPVPPQRDHRRSTAGSARLGSVVPFLLVAAAVIVGESTRRRTEIVAALGATQEAMAVSEREQTAMEERARIARELHDIVAHHLSVIAVQSETARLTSPRLSADARRRFEAIGETARDALTETRRLLGVLREDVAGEPDRAPQPGLDAAPRAHRHRARRGRDDPADHAGQGRPAPGRHRPRRLSDRAGGADERPSPCARRRRRRRALVRRRPAPHPRPGPRPGPGGGRARRRVTASSGCATARRSPAARSRAARPRAAASSVEVTLPTGAPS